MTSQPDEVLGDEVYKKIETVDAFCAKIVDKKTTPELLKQVDAVDSLSNLQHLKRVKGKGKELYLLLTTKDDSKLEAIKDLAGLTDIVPVEVPKHKPITRAQYEAAKLLWPTKFHEDKRLEKSLSGKLFSEEEFLLMKHFMMMAIAEQRKDLRDAGAIIVDPNTGDVVARGASCPSHPLKHAVMVCIDNVAAAQGGGAWSSLQQSGINISPGSAPPAKKKKTDQCYLCTGYDVYITMEPCLMCAMALLHSRIRRVFYGRRNRFGALGTQFKIHLNPRLNHHFQVFSGLLKKECDCDT